MTLALYFARKFLISFVAVVLSIALLILLIDFLTNLSRLSGLDDPVRNAATLSLYRTTTYLSLAMPLVVLIASLAFSVGLARSSEFVISRASGLSALRSLLSVIVVGFLLGVISVFVFDPIGGKMVAAYDAKLDKLRGTQKQDVTVNASGYWMRQTTADGHQIIKASSASDNGRVLRNISFYDYDRTGQIQSRSFAPSAFLYSGEWVLTNGVTWTDDKLDSDPKTASDDFKVLRIPTEITPAQLLDGYPAPETIAPWGMRDQIARVASSGFSTLKYRSHQMSQYARPFLFAVMVIIGCVFTLQNARLGNLGVSVVTSVIFGFAVHFLQSFSTTLGRSGEISLGIAAWSPVLSAGLVAIALFLHYEDG